MSQAEVADIYKHIFLNEPADNMAISTTVSQTQFEHQVNFSTESTDFSPDKVTMRIFRHDVQR